jgi:hypothetical protein
MNSTNSQVFVLTMLDDKRISLRISPGRMRLPFGRARPERLEKA